MAMRPLLAALLLAGLPAGAWAESPVAAQVRSWANRYNEDLPRIDRARSDLAAVVKGQPQVEDLIALAHVCFLWGDVRARTPEEKLEAYAQGREAARRAIELAPHSVLAHFWYGTNTGRWGQTKGVVRSLFLLPTVKQEVQTVLALDPKFAPGYALAGYVYVEVPPLLGGDLDRAEQMFRDGLGLDPKYTNMRVGLAKTLIKKGRIAEARRELESVLEENAPSNPADWALKDVRQARELLESIRGPS
jgi:tetratricopeptide (TPR) repeat protein